MPESTDFSAKAPSLGYFYQIRYGLYLLLKKNSDDDSVLKIECLDDISIENKNETNFIQTKLHIDKSKDLTNSSPDFWKTIRVWCESILNDGFDPEICTYCLITTQELSKRSFLQYFSIEDSYEEGENQDSIILKMIEICNTSTNETNRKAYESFKKLSKDQQISLVKNIYILDSSLDIDQIETNIKHELRLNTTKERIPALFERLEGWWFGECIDHLLEKKTRITKDEVFSKVYALTDQLKEDNLPVDFPKPLGLDDDALLEAKESKFLKQLQLIGIGSRGQLTALSDFRRAFNQKSRWTRNHLINPQEIIEYDNKLIDYWERRFNHMIDEVESKGLTSQEMEEKGNTFYKDNYVNQTPPTNIKERFTESFLAIGSSHILSDELKIGWHPEYENRLKDD